MTAEEFIPWALAQPDGTQYKLVHVQVIGMAPERLGHVRGKQRMFRLLADAISAAGVSCEALVDGAVVQVDEATVHEPDALVRCGPPLPDDTIRITDPLIVVEVLLPSSRSRDASLKLADYFRMPSVRHYPIVATDIRTVIHHFRDETGAILTRVVRDGRLLPDPPGITLEGIFAASETR